MDAAPLPTPFNWAKWPSTLQRPVIDRCAARQSLTRRVPLCGTVAKRRRAKPVATCQELKALRPTLTDGLPTESTIEAYDSQVNVQRRAVLRSMVAMRQDFKLGKTCRTSRPIRRKADRPSPRAYPSSAQENSKKPWASPLVGSESPRPPASYASAYLWDGLAYSRGDSQADGLRQLM